MVTLPRKAIHQDGHVAAVGEIAKDSIEVKKTTDNAKYYDALQVVL